MNMQQDKKHRIGMLAVAIPLLLTLSGCTGAQVPITNITSIQPGQYQLSYVIESEPYAEVRSHGETLAMIVTLDGVEYGLLLGQNSSLKGSFDEQFPGSAELVNRRDKTSDYLVELTGGDERRLSLQGRTLPIWKVHGSESKINKVCRQNANLAEPQWQAVWIRDCILRSTGCAPNDQHCYFEKIACTTYRECMKAWNKLAPPYSATMAVPECVASGRSAIACTINYAALTNEPVLCQTLPSENQETCKDVIAFYSQPYATRDP
jgi:hypothetical protein